MVVRKINLTGGFLGTGVVGRDGRSHHLTVHQDMKMPSCLLVPRSPEAGDKGRADPSSELSVWIRWWISIR